MHIFIAIAMSKTQAVQEKFISNAQRRENYHLSPQGTIEQMKMAWKKAVKKFSWRKTIVKVKTDSSRTSASKWKKNYASNQVHAATVQPICYTLRHNPGVNPKHEAWGQPSALFLLPRCQQGHHTCPAAPLSTPGHSATDVNRRLQGRSERHHQLLLLSFRREGAQRDSAHPFWCPHLTEPSQKITVSLSIQKHELQFILKSATAGQWTRGAPQHCLIYFCAAQNLDAERGLWNVSKMIIVFFAKTAKSFLASKKHLGDRNK